MLTERLCRKRVCLVVGSAPNVVVELVQVSISKNTIIIGANGGGRIAYDHFGRCDVLCTTTHLFQRLTPYEIEIAESISTIPFSSVWVDTKTTELYPIDVNSNHVQRISNGYREEIIYQATSTREWVSTGVWAMCLAKVSGAKRVIHAGISLSSGHYGFGGNQPRMHINADRQVLSTIGVVC